MLKVFVVGAVIVAAMVVAKRDHFFARAGIVGTCQLTEAPYGDTAQWWSCKQGILTGFPVLTGQSCDSQGFVLSRELWRCPEPLQQAPGAV